MSTDLEPELADRRHEPRHRAMLTGKLLHGDAFTVDCAIRDIAAEGARINLPDDVELPAQLYLIEVRNGVAYEAQIIWRRPPLAGLRFLSRHDLKAATKMTHLRRLWLECAAR